MSDQTNTISLNTAKSWTKEWRDKENTYNSHNEVNAFLIPAVDLRQALELLEGQTGDTYVRAYLGVETVGSKSEEKLAIVATKAETQSDGSVIYKDLIYGKVDGRGVTDPNSDVNSGIFDFTKPCPTYCDPQSPLN